MCEMCGMPPLHELDAHQAAVADHISRWVTQGYPIQVANHPDRIRRWFDTSAELFKIMMAEPDPATAISMLSELAAELLLRHAEQSTPP